MRVYAATLVLLLGGTTAFVPFGSRKLLVRSNQLLARARDGTLLFAAQEGAPRFPTPKVTSTTPISTDSIRMKNIMEARACLLEVEAAAEQARDHLAYLEEVAQQIRSYLDDQDTPLRANLREDEIENAEKATEYLTNIEKATNAAIEYLQYLDEMSYDIKTYLTKLDEQYQAGRLSNESSQRAEEAKMLLADLEDTAKSAREYLMYLQDVAGEAQKYLVDLHFEDVDRAIAAGTQQPVELKTMADFLPQPPASSRATHVITQPSTKVVPPPSPALEVDTTRGPTPVKRIEAPPMETIAKSLEIAQSSVSSMASAPSTGSYLESLQVPPAKAVSSGSMSYLDSLASVPKSKGIPKAGGTIQGYLDSIAPSSERKFAPVKPSGGYLDNINNPPMQHQAGSTPTSHFKESASSTPFSEVGPPERGRSDVSHMDRYDTGNAPGAPTTASYLDRMSPAGGTPRAAAPLKTAPTTSSYLDQMLPALNGPPEPAAKYSDEFETQPSHRVRMVPRPKAAPMSTSYLNPMSSPAATSPRKAVKKAGPASYLDQISQPTQPIDWSQAAPREPATSAPPAQQRSHAVSLRPKKEPSMTTGGIVTAPYSKPSFLGRLATKAGGARPTRPSERLPSHTTGGIQQAPYISPSFLDRHYPTVNAPLRTLKKEIAPDNTKRETKRSSVLQILASKVKKSPSASEDCTSLSYDPMARPEGNVYDRYVKNVGIRKF